MTRPVRRVFPGRQDQVACAREFIRRKLGPCPVLDEAVLLTSELCANALQHTASGNGGSFEVTVFRGDHSLRIEVRDDGATTIPAVRPADDLEESGRGLELVALIASRWGQCGDEYGRSVYYELRWAQP
jgi:anti-sigma regulatory factor (Ser/Thr protein kinase)